MLDSTMPIAEIHIKDPEWPCRKGIHGGDVCLSPALLDEDEPVSYQMLLLLVVVVVVLLVLLLLFPLTRIHKKGANPKSVGCSHGSHQGLNQATSHSHQVENRVGWRKMKYQYNIPATSGWTT
jgi:hypothetical protein